MKMAWIRAFEYKATVYGFRLGNIVEILFQVVIWTAIYKSTAMVNGYTYNDMMTYVIIGWLFISVTQNYGMDDVIGRDIRQGTLSAYLLKPLSYLRYSVLYSLGRVSLATFSGVVIQGFFILIFYKHVLPPSSVLNIFLILVMVFLGYFIRLFLSIAIGAIAFWTTETDGLFSFASTLIKFLSGGFFPLNLLPNSLVSLSSFFPFAYIIFFPTQLYLGKISTNQGLIGIGVEVLWLIGLYGIIKFVWKKGIKIYEGVGI